MSLQDAKNRGPPALYWTDIRLRKLAVDDGFEVDGPTEFNDNVDVDGNLTVTGTINGTIAPGTVSPGANNTFLHTNTIGAVVWQPFSAANITGGNDYDILTKDPVLGWRAQQLLRNQNLPDPLQVDNVIANTELSSALLDVDDIEDASSSLGTAGQVLAKSNPGNVLEWTTLASAAINADNFVLSANPYKFPNILNNIVFNTNDTRSGSPDMTLEPDGSITVNNANASTVYRFDFSLNAMVSDSSSQWRIRLYRNSGLLILYTAYTPKLQAADTNNYTQVSFTRMFTTTVINDNFFVTCERTSGAGTMSTNPGGTDVSCSLIITRLN